MKLIRVGTRGRAWLSAVRPLYRSICSEGRDKRLGSGLVQKHANTCLKDGLFGVELNSQTLLLPVAISDGRFIPRLDFSAWRPAFFTLCCAELWACGWTGVPNNKGLSKQAGKYSWNSYARSGGKVGGARGSDVSFALLRMFRASRRGQKQVLGRRAVFQSDRGRREPLFH